MTIFHIMEKKGGPVLSDPLQAIKGTQSNAIQFEVNLSVVSNFLGSLQTCPRDCHQINLCFSSMQLSFDEYIFFHLA